METHIQLARCDYVCLCERVSIPDASLLSRYPTVNARLDTKWSLRPFQIVVFSRDGVYLGNFFVSVGSARIPRRCCYQFAFLSRATLLCIFKFRVFSCSFCGQRPQYFGTTSELVNDLVVRHKRLRFGNLFINRRSSSVTSLFIPGHRFPMLFG